MSQTATRSHSAPPDRGGDRIINTLAPDEVSPFPSLSPEIEVGVDTPAWIRELYSSRSSRRPSRASSIVSTRTRFSTTTLDEVRSIEISAGGQTYRISRDGAQITDTTAPPPYSGSWWDNSIDEQLAADAGRDEDDTTPVDDHAPMDDNHEDIDGTPVPETAERGRRKRVRIVMPNEEEEEDAPDPEEDKQGPSARRQLLTKADMYELMLDLPVQLKRVLGIWPARGARSKLAEPAVLNDVELSERATTRPTSSQSLPDSFVWHEPSDAPPEASQRETGTANDQSANRNLESAANLELTPKTESVDVNLTFQDLNELSRLYNRVIRDLDREHRKKLHERDKEMAHLRQLLNEKDIVYRQQLRAKDFVIEDLKARISHHEDTLEGKLEQARNEVEDVWEQRWKDRDSHLMGRMKRMEESARRSKNERAEAGQGDGDYDSGGEGQEKVD